MNITLRPIDESNFIDCFNLQLGDGQDKFVSHPIRSLPFGVYAGDTMAGYVMVIYDYDEEAYNIWHMMIDKAYQGRGYGKAAMQRVLSYIASKPFGNSNHVSLTCAPDNKAAYGLYKRLGFNESGRSDEDEVELELYLK